jgi:MFS family permease
VYDFARVLERGRGVAARWLACGEVAPQWNYWNLYRDIAWYGVLAAVSSTFVSVYTLRLGGSNLLVGLLTSLPALINVLVQMPAARLIERQHNTRTLLLAAGFLSRLSVFLIALVPVLLQRWQAGAVVWITALGTIPGAISNLAFTAMMADVVAPQDRAHVVSVRNVLFSAMTTLSVIAAGKALDILPFPFSYQLIFTLAFATSLVSLYYVGRIAIPDHAPVPQPAASDQRTDWRRLLHIVLAQRDYARFTLASFMFHWGLYFPIPLYAIYRVRTLHISEGWIGALAMIESGVTILTWYIWGKVAESRGSRYVLLLGVMGVCFYPFGTALSRSAWPLVFVSALAGIAGPAFNLGIFNGLLEVAPDERRPTYVAVFNVLMNLAACISPLLGTTAASWLGIRPALYIGGMLRVAGFLAYVLLLGA